MRSWAVSQEPQCPEEVQWQERILLRAASYLTTSATGALASAPSLLPKSHIFFMKFIRKDLCLFWFACACVCLRVWMKVPAAGRRGD